MSCFHLQATCKYPKFSKGLKTLNTKIYFKYKAHFCQYGIMFGYIPLTYFKYILSKLEVACSLR